MTDKEMMLYLLSKVAKAPQTTEPVTDYLKTVHEPVFEAVYPGHFYEHNPRVVGYVEKPTYASEVVHFRTNGFMFDEDGNIVAHYAEYD